MSARAVPRASAASAVAWPPPRVFAWLVAAACVLALGLRLIAVAQYERDHPLAQRPVIDEASYERWALEIAGGDWLGSEIFFQEPLYPYALGGVYAAAGDDLATQRGLARRLQAFLGAATVALVALLGRRIFSPLVGVIAAFGLAVYRPAVWFPALLLKENLFVPLLALFALALVAAGTERTSRARTLALWLAVGFLAGLGALLRGNMLILLPAFLVWPLARAVSNRARVWRALAASGAVALGATLALAPVALRNQAVGGKLVLTTSGAGTNFYGGNNLANPYGLATEFDWVRGVPEHEEGDWRHEAERRTGRALDATETSDFWLRAALESMASAPLAHARILWNKLRLTLGRYEVPDNHFLEWDARYVALLALPLPGFAVWGTLGLGGFVLFAWSAWRLRGRGVRLQPALDVALLFLLYLATIVLTVTSERARLPLLPLLFPFAGFALISLVTASRGREPVLAPFAALALAGLFVLVPAMPADEAGEDLDERDFDLAVGLLDRDGDIARAHELALALDERHPGTPRVQILIADTEYRLARAVLDEPSSSAAANERARAKLDEIRSRLARAREQSNARERFSADVIAGAIEHYLGRWSAAILHYREALVFDPEDRDLRHRMAAVRAEEAMTHPPGAERSAGLRAAEEILVALLASGADPEQERLLAQIRAKL